MPRRPGLRVLHFAPEAGIARELRAIPGVRYTSADIDPQRAMRRLDLTALELDDASVDLIFISHVLEHIVDDRRAMHELFRVLSPGGLAFVEVPVLRRVTHEDPTVTSPNGRRSEYGQSDHVRVCGLDYAERLVRAGFRVEALEVTEQFSSAEIERMRLRVELPEAMRLAAPDWYEGHHEVSWLCRKP